VNHVPPVFGIASDFGQHQRSEDEKRRQRDKKLDTFTRALQDAVKKEGTHDENGSGSPVR
jgi:hypothetical protein